MPTAIKAKRPRKSKIRGLNQEIARLRSRVEELENLKDLDAAIARNQGKPGVPWAKVKTMLGLD